ncbi:TlpA family protein disulfide reductase [Methylobacter sp.]|uniref:TlpA family protein disulfide reductase n=1 Tax=Methylobacter sp. TaxID=2051955 RepID=UPI002FDEF79C
MNQRILVLLFAALTVTPIRTIIAAEVGGNAPDCLLSSMNGEQSYSLKQFHDKVLYVDFWASWCPPCAKSFPFLNDLNRDLKDSGLQVIGINLDQEPEDAKAFLAKYPANFSVASDINEKCARDLDVKAMPTAYLVDRHGVIRHIHFGFRPGEAKALRVLAEQLLAEKSGQE